MSFAVVHMQKFSRGSVRGIQSHNQREKLPATNPDVDMSKSGENYDLINAGNINYHRQITERIEQLRKPGQKAVRKDAVVLCNFIVSSDHEFFEKLSPEQTRKFFQESLEFFRKRYGADKIINATIHLDEYTPHMHLGFVPITEDGRLSAKDIFTKKELRELQTDFVREVGQHWNLERGKEGSDKTHLTEQQYKAKMAKEQAELARQEAEKTALQARTSLNDAKKSLEATKVLRNQQNVLKGQIEGLQEQFEKDTSRNAQENQNAKEVLKDLLKQKEALEGHINGLQGMLHTYQQIDSIGEKTGLRGNKVVMSNVEAEKLKEQAKAYLREKSKVDSLSREKIVLERQAEQAYEYRDQIFKLKQSNQKKDNKINVMTAVLESDPDLTVNFNNQLARLQDQERREWSQRPERGMDFER